MEIGRLRALLVLAIALGFACAAPKSAGVPDSAAGGGGGGSDASGGSGGAPCKAGGQACEAFSECCSGNCTQLVCTACQAEGASCTNNSPCCAGLTCLNPNALNGLGKCVPACKFEAASCTLSSECCSGACDQGQCRACVGLRQTCANTADYCCPLPGASISCHGLTDPVNVRIQCCVNPGSSCQDPLDCCFNTCVNGVCPGG